MTFDFYKFMGLALNADNLAIERAFQLKKALLQRNGAKPSDYYALVQARYILLDPVARSELDRTLATVPGTTVWTALQRPSSNNRVSNHRKGSPLSAITPQQRYENVMSIAATRLRKVISSSYTTWVAAIEDGRDRERLYIGGVSDAFFTVLVKAADVECRRRILAASSLYLAKQKRAAKILETTER